MNGAMSELTPTEKELAFIDDFKKLLEKHSVVIGVWDDGDCVLLNDYFDPNTERKDEIYLYLESIAKIVGWYRMEQSNESE